MPKVNLVFLLLDILLFCGYCAAFFWLTFRRAFRRLFGRWMS